MEKKKRTRTITLSVSVDDKAFFEELSEAGLNRSHLYKGLTEILRILWEQSDTYPGGIRCAVRDLARDVREGKCPKSPADAG